MDPLDCIIYSATSFSLAFILGNNFGNYNDAKNWIFSHGIEPSFYEDRKKEKIIL